MTSTASAATFTPEDLLTMADGDRYELLDGHLVEHGRSTLASFVAGVIYHLLASHSFAKQAGWPFPEGATYQCFPAAANRVRKADVSVFRWERRTLEDLATEGHCPLVPDLVVEVVSPNDEVYEVDDKVQEWLDAGARCVWVVNPQRHTVEVHRAQGAGAILREQDELNGEDAVPGFQCRVGDCFKMPAPASA